MCQHIIKAGEAWESLVMKTRRLINTLDCEQIYKVWSTEPELIRIFDLRSAEEFGAFHIPGAQNIAATELAACILALNGRLGVLITPSGQLEHLKAQYGHLDDVVFLENCSRWAGLGYPVERNDEMN